METEVMLRSIEDAGFTMLGWFTPRAGDGVPGAIDGHPARSVILIGNAGASMFQRFKRERPQDNAFIDPWTEDVVRPLADRLGARALFPFHKPYQPFLSWARAAGCGHVSPLGLNIHNRYGLWHAFRAALVIRNALDFPTTPTSRSPCATCVDKPCLTACPVSAFSPHGYDVPRCTNYLTSPAGDDCMKLGCAARRACPIGRQFRYSPSQSQFFMRAFQQAHCEIS